MNDNQLAQLGVLTALNQMMRSKYFDICVVDAAVKALGTQPDGRAYQILRTVHCVHWGDMPAELREAIPKLIERCINVPAYQFQLTALTPDQQVRLQGNTIRLLTRDA